MKATDASAALPPEDLALLGRTLVTLVCRIGEELVDATERCGRCNGVAACDACFAALQTTMRFHRLAREIEARLAGADPRMRLDRGTGPIH